jgi:hypothetical protein
MLYSNFSLIKDGIVSLEKSTKEEKQAVVTKRLAVAKRHGRSNDTL